MKKEILNFLKNEELEDVRIATDKFGKTVILINNPSFKKKANVEAIKIFSGENFKKIGEVQYGFKYDSKNKYIALQNIKIYEKKKLLRGIGSYAIKFLEEIAYSHGFYVIEGKYCIKAPSTEGQLKKFYTRNGYDIEQYGCVKIVYKYLIKEDAAVIKNNTTLNENGYKVYGLLQNMSAKKEIDLEK